MNWELVVLAWNLFGCSAGVLGELKGRPLPYCIALWLLGPIGLIATFWIADLNGPEL